MGKSLNGKELGVGLTQRKDGTYQGTFTDYFGKRHFVYGKTLKEVREKLEEKKQEDKVGILVNKCEFTLDEWFDTCVSTFKKHCRNTTIELYKSQYRLHLKEPLGKMKIRDLNVLVMQNVINNINSKSGRINAKSILKELLGHAEDLNYIQGNPALKLKDNNGKKTRHDKMPLTSEEIARLKEVSKKSIIHPFIIIALNTGMRCGEILALTWDCIDFTNNIIKVKNNLVYADLDGHYAYDTHEPKTMAGFRHIPMTEEVRSLLLNLYSPQKSDNEYVLKNKKGAPLYPSYCRQYLLDVKNDVLNNKNGQLSPHILRHTFATHAIASGMNPKAVQYIMGHENVNTTLGIYTKVLLDTLYDEMSKYGKMPA